MTRIAGNLSRPGLVALAFLIPVAGAMEAPAFAQDVYAQPVVQPLPNPATYRLSEALRQLGQNPRSIDALMDAGQASLALDDPEAALGFFQRAQAVNPDDGRVKAGMASVMIRQGHPLEALRLFAEAEQAGEAMLLHAADRGLAYDLIGDNARAQKEYAASLAFAADPAITQRLALSQAIAGDQLASDATLLPLLQKSDLSAYRTRAFSLAILGKSDEAVTIAETMLPERLSGRLAPYLRYMPRLTRAQQAAAANLGTFPPAAQIGRDDPALVAYAAQLGVQPSAPVVAATAADSRLVPAGEPLGPRAGRVPRREEVAAQQPASPPPQVAAVTVPAPTPAPAPIPTPRVATAAPTAAPALAQPPRPAAATPEPAPQPAQQGAQLVQAPVEQPLPQPIEPASPAPVVVSVLPGTANPEPPASFATRQPVPEPAGPPPATHDLVQAFSDFSRPVGPAVPANGAVDITKIVPKREPPPRPAVTVPPKPVIPSRHWVQVATGRDADALAFDWRRIKRAAGGLLDKVKPNVAEWGQTNRLVAGPFDSAKEANDMVAKLKEKKLDSFRFTSAQGEEVKPLD